MYRSLHYPKHYTALCIWYVPLFNSDVCLPPVARDALHFVHLTFIFDVQWVWVVGFFSAGCGSQHSAFERTWTSRAGVRKESSILDPGKHQVCVCLDTTCLHIAPTNVHTDIYGSGKKKKQLCMLVSHSLKSIYETLFLPSPSEGTPWYQERQRRF